MSEATREQKNKIHKFVPSNQNSIMYTFIADITQNGRRYTDGAITCSEHFIVFSKKSLFCGYSLLNYTHILELESFEVQSKRDVFLSFNDYSIRIAADEATILRFARTFLKNYGMIKMILPPFRQCSITYDDNLGIGEFYPSLSPTQMFQVLYKANCTLMNVPYCHDVTQFVHNLIVTEDCIADFTRMPLYLVDDTYSSAINLEPAFESIKYLPTIYGIQLKDVAQPDFFKHISSMVRESPNIRLISLEACNVTEGIPEFALALTENKNLHLEYLDISDNPFNDLTPLSAALARNKGDLWYLDFSNCGMSNEAVKVAMMSLIGNENLWGIIHLDFRGATVKDDSVDLIIRYLTVCGEGHSTTLRFLSFGSIQKRLSNVIHTLMKYPQPIETLYLNGCTFDQAAVEALITYLKTSHTIEELDISDTNLKPKEVADIIYGIAKNQHIKHIELKLEGLNLNKEALNTVLEAFMKTKGFPWRAVSFDSNKMGPEEIQAIANVFQHIRTISGLSIGNNIKKRADGTKAIKSILDLPNLKRLWIRGGDQGYIGKKLAPIIAKARKLKLLDISFNHIKDAGIDALNELIRDNNNIIELVIDGSHPHTPQVLIDFMTNASKHPTLRKLKFPAEDIYYIINRFVPKTDRKDIFKQLSYKQKAIQDNLLFNETNKGLHSDLSEQRIPELDDMLDEMTADSHSRIESYDTFTHSGATLAYGLPFPHLEEDDDQERDLEDIDDVKMYEEFDLPEGMKVCKEKPPKTTSMHAKACAMRKGGNFMSSSRIFQTKTIKSGVYTAGGPVSSHYGHASEMPEFFVG